MARLRHWRHSLSRPRSLQDARAAGPPPDRPHVKPGDEVFAIETAQGILLTPYYPTFERAIAAYQRTVGKYRNALHELPK
jgi:hypothetical protein